MGTDRKHMAFDSTNSAFDAPLSELRFDVRLRRALIRAGFGSLREVLLAGDERLEDALSQDSLYALDNLRERIEKDPEVFASAAVQRRTPDEEAETARRIAENRHRQIETASNRGKAPSGSTRSRTARDNVPVPDEPFAAALAECEEKARRALSVLADHADSAIIAESFPRLALELDAIRSGFVDLFSFYHFSQGMALQAACAHYPSAFLVFVAQSASEDFDGDAFWNNLYELLKIDSQNVQGDLKAAFYRGVQDRGLPHFTAEESDFHLLNTALLHGGFSESFWRPMWADILLPFARANEGAWLSRRSGIQLLQEIKKDESRYSLNRVYARRIIQKAPISMLEPLMESALQAASEVVDAEKYSDAGSTEFGMMSSHGLTDQAMQALRSILESRGARAARRIVYLPPGELRITPEEGDVHIHWDAQKLPGSFAGRAIEYYVNGELRATAQINMGVGKCVLEERDIALKPSERFDVELAMTEADDPSARLATLNQTFDRTRPGSFEFVESADGAFRLRRKGERIKKTKVVAFLTMPDLWVEPGSGMTELEAYDAGEGWKGASIQLFEVAPGSSGSIVNIRTRETIACWQEDYRVEIDRSHIIGKTADKRDLYGFSYVRELGTNASLPEIEIEAEDVTAVRGDLEISCTCDGQRVSLPWKAVQDEIDHDLALSGRLLVKPRETSAIPRFVADGLIRIVQKSTGQALLNYKFAVIPARSFGIERIYWEGEGLHATYTLEAMDPITIPDEDGDYEMVAGDRYYFDAPLEHDRIRTTVTSGTDGKRLDIALYLANVEVRIPDEIKEINKARPLCMADAESVDGKISLISTGRRHSRVAAVMMGYEPLLFKKLSGNTTYSFDIFKDPRRLALRGAPEEKDVRLILSHGERTDRGRQVEASAEIVLARCSTGFNLGEAGVRWRLGSPSLCFENAAPMDFEVRFSGGRHGEPLGNAELVQGADSVALQGEVSYRLDTRKAVAVTVVPLSIFGEPDEDMAIEFELKR